SSGRIRQARSSATFAPCGAARTWARSRIIWCGSSDFVSLLGTVGSSELTQKTPILQRRAGARLLFDRRWRECSDRVAQGVTRIAVRMSLLRQVADDGPVSTARIEPLPVAGHSQNLRVRPGRHDEPRLSVYELPEHAQNRLDA